MRVAFFLLLTAPLVALSFPLLGAPPACSDTLIQTTGDYSYLIGGSGYSDPDGDNGFIHFHLSESSFADRLLDLRGLQLPS